MIFNADKLFSFQLPHQFFQNFMWRGDQASGQYSIAIKPLKHKFLKINQSFGVFWDNSHNVNTLVHTEHVNTGD